MYNAANVWTAAIGMIGVTIIGYFVNEHHKREVNDRAEAREHELKMAEYKLKLAALGVVDQEPVNRIAQDAIDELKQLREARARARAQAQPKVDTKTDKVRPFPTRASSIAAAQAFERNPGAFVFKSVA